MRSNFIVKNAEGADEALIDQRFPSRTSAMNRITPRMEAGTIRSNRFIRPAEFEMPLTNTDRFGKRLLFSSMVPMTALLYKSGI